MKGDKMTTREILMGTGMTEVEADEAIEGIKSGLRDIKAGKVKPLSEIKKATNV